MYPIMKVLTFCLLLLSLMGCASIGKQMKVPVPVVSDTETMLEMEQKKTEALNSDAGEKLKDMAAEDHLANGYSALKRHDSGVAKLHFTLALAKNSGLSKAFLGLAEALMMEGRFQEAQVVLEKVPGKEEDLDAQVKLGILSRAMGDLSGAIEYLVRAYGMAPEDGWLATELAVTYEQAGQVEKGGELFKKASLLLPNSSVAHNNLGFNYILQGKYQEAIQTLEKSLELSPDNKVATNNLALAYAFHKNARKSLRLFENSVGKAGAYNNLGYICLLMDQDESAKYALSKAVELNPRFYTRANQNLELLQSNQSDEQVLFK